MCFDCVLSTLLTDDEYDRAWEDGTAAVWVRELVTSRWPEDSSTRTEVRTLIHDWYTTHDFATGGPLHAQLDDYNLEDELLDAEKLDEGWKLYEERRTAAAERDGRRILELLRGMSEVERVTVVHEVHEEGGT